MKKTDNKMKKNNKTHVHNELEAHKDVELQECTELHDHAHDDVVTHTHTHVLEDGTVITHTHTHTNTKAVLNRLSKAIGHLEAIKRMVEEGRDCAEVLTQLAAVKSAINNTGNVILKDHMEHCIVDAVRDGDMASVEELNKAIDRFMK